MTAPAPVAEPRPDLSDETFLLELKPGPDPIYRHFGIRRTAIYRLRLLLKNAARCWGFKVAWGRESATIPLTTDDDNAGGSMVRFTDGPAAGRTLNLRRSPLYLRVTFDPATKKWDGLDQLSDEPAAGEQVIVYRRVGEPSVAFLDWSDATGRRCGGRVAMWSYELVQQQPEDAVLRDTAKWQAWCVTAQAAAKAAKGAA
jgi:hypothetical protein